jgi:Cu/Ag efflux protein CusF
MYDGETLGSGEMIDVINGKKPIPMHLLSGYANSLCVDKCNFKLGTKKPRTDSLTIQGTFAVEDTSVDIASKDIVISWGDVYNITLPKETMFQVKDDIFKYKKPMGSDLSIAAAIFNLKKCTFKIVINKAEIAWQGNPVEFRIQFDDFNETSIIQLRENKNYWFFP